MSDVPMDALRDAGLVDDEQVDETPPEQAPVKRPRRQCAGTTKAGKRCRKAPKKDSDLCNTCDPEDPVSTRFAAGEEHTVGPGRPSKLELWRERVDEEFEEWIAPYYEMRDQAVKLMKMGDKINGEYVEEFIDIGARVSAAEKVFDRVYGRPTNRQEVSGPDGGPIQMGPSIDLTRLSREKLLALRAILDEAQVAPAEGDAGAAT